MRMPPPPQGIYDYYGESKKGAQQGVWPQGTHNNDDIIKEIRDCSAQGSLLLTSS